MRIHASFRPKTILALLIIVIVITAISYLLFISLTKIVHGDLYNYGLTYDDDWALRYWSNSNPFQITLLLTIGSVGFSLIFLLWYTKKRVLLAKNACYLLFFTGALTSISSIYFINNIDFIVHHDLPTYGLRFSLEWASSYWTYATSIQILMSIAALLTAGSYALLVLGSRKSVDINFYKIVILSLISAGITLLAISIVQALEIPALIGLGLIFWGLIFTYVRSDEYTKKTVFDATMSSQQSTIQEILTLLNYKGPITYLPPKYFSNPQTVKIYIAKEKKGKLPAAEFTQKEESCLFSSNPPSVLLSPPGLGLTKLFEKTLKINLAQVDLQFLQKNMPNLFIEDLELCQEFEIKLEDNKVYISIANLLLGTDRDAEGNYGKNSELSPLISAVACALAKTTGYPVRVEHVERNNEGKNLIIEYCIVREAQPKP
jgi:hypothetical protein